MEFIENRRGNDSQALVLTGEWIIGNAFAIEQAIQEQAQGNKEKVTVDASRIKRLDTAGAWLIHKHFPDTALQNLSKQQKELMDFARGGQQELPPKKSLPAVVAFFADIGKAAEDGMEFVYALFSFLGVVFACLAKNLRYPARFRLPSIVRHIHETGIQALPIIGLLAFGISMVTSYQGATQLQKFGADIYTVDLTVISLLREMAVLTTAIMVAGRSGSAFAAEIGVMKMRGEVDALRTIGMDPFETLVVPRFLAMLVTLPVLAFFADIVGIAGGGFMSVMQLDLSPSAYVERVRGIATPTMFFIGMIKAPVFALLITAVCTYQGMSARGSAENVGKVTTLAVVQSIFLVIMADAIFSVIFSHVGI